MFSFAGDAVLTAGKDGKGGEEVVADPPVSGCFSWRRVGPRAASGGGA